LAGGRPPVSYATDATRQLPLPPVSYAPDQVHFKTPTSSFDRVTRNNRYDSANAGRSLRAVGISTQQLACGLTNRHFEIHGNSLEGSMALSPRQLNKTNFRE